VIEPMRWWDIGAAVAIDGDVFGASAWSAATFWSELAGVPASRTYLVSRDETGLTGYAGINQVGSEVDIQTIAVRPDRQRIGLGAALLQELIRAARDRDAGSILLEVRADNAAAQRLYAAHGFEQLSVRRRYYPDGADALILRRLLRSSARFAAQPESMGADRG
jgi:ribosomal-protein-alanine N-acetyltransferase